MHAHDNQSTSSDGLQDAVLELLRPIEVSPQTVGRALRRAIRYRLYHRLLSPLERALLRAASQARVARYTSPTLKKKLADLVARIEAHTRHGLIVKLGLQRLAGITGLTPGQGLLHKLREKLDYIKYLGWNLLETLNYYTPHIQT